MNTKFEDNTVSINMNTFKANKPEAYIYEQQKRQERKNDKNLRNLRKSRKSLWASKED